MTFTNIILVGLGGFVGSIARFTLSETLNKNEKSLPVGTLFVNLFGAFLLGLMICLNVNEFVSLFIGTGFLGALTTFSTLNFETLQLFKRKQVVAICYLVITYCVGIALPYVIIVIF